MGLTPLGNMHEGRFTLLMPLMALFFGGHRLTSFAGCSLSSSYHTIPKGFRKNMKHTQPLANPSILWLLMLY
jgi:hypothetical protein